MSTPNAERDQLRTEVERADVIYQRACEVEHELRAELERLRSDRDCEKRLRKDAEELREDANERAERAEDELLAVKADLDQVACARTDGILRESDLQCTLNIERKQFNKVKIALTDAISTYFGDDKLVTAERIEAWQAALKEDAK